MPNLRQDHLIRLWPTRRSLILESFDNGQGRPPASRVDHVLVLPAAHDPFAQQPGVATVARVLLDHMDHDIADRHDSPVWSGQLAA